MHKKLRLRKSKPDVQGSSKTASNEQLKARIQHVTADHLEGDRGKRSGQLDRVEVSLGEGNDFRTSLILPALTKRFTLLRSQDGTALSVDQMQAHLRTQRETGRLTAAEEETILQQYRIQSLYHAARVGEVSSTGPLGRSASSSSTRHQQQHVGASQYAGPTASPSSAPTMHRNNSGSRSATRASPGHTLNTWQEERERVSIVSSSAMGQDSEGTSSHGRPGTGTSTSTNAHPPQFHHRQQYLSQSTHASRSTPSDTPLTSPSTKAPSTRGGALSPSMSSSAPPSSNANSASAAAASFYAARDAAMKGNNSFLGGGLERDVVQKYVSRPEQGDGSGTASDGERATTPGSLGRRRTRRLYSASAGDRSPSSASEGRSPDIGSPARAQGYFADSPDVPPLPSFLLSPQSAEKDKGKGREKRQSYDPFRPRESEELGTEKEDSPKAQQQWGGASGAETEVEVKGLGLQPPLLSRKQLNRISKVLDDLAAELKTTHHVIPDPTQEGAGDPEAGEEANMLEGDFVDEYGYEDSEGHSHEYRHYPPGAHYGFHDTATSAYAASGRRPSDGGDVFAVPGYTEPDAFVRTLVHSSSGTSASASSRSIASSHKGQQFVYDDTEEIDPPLLRVPSIQDLNKLTMALSSETLQNGYSWQMGGSGLPNHQTDQKHASLADSERTQLTARSLQAVPDIQTGLNGHHRYLRPQASSNTLGSSPGLPYLQPSPNIDVNTRGYFTASPSASGSDISPARASEEMLATSLANEAVTQREMPELQDEGEILSASNSVPVSHLPVSTSSGSVRLPPPMSAVQATFPHSISQNSLASSSATAHYSSPSKVSALKQSTSMTLSRSSSTSSSSHNSGPPRSPPPQIALPPVPSQPHSRSHSRSSSLHRLLERSASSRSIASAIRPPPAPNGQVGSSYSQFSSFDAGTPSIYSENKQHDLSSFAFPASLRDSSGSSDRLTDLTQAAMYRSAAKGPRNSVLPPVVPKLPPNGRRASTESTGSDGSSFEGNAFSPINSEFSNSLSPTRQAFLRDSYVPKARVVAGLSTAPEETQLERDERGLDVQLFLQNNTSGLDMDDLKDIQDRLTQSAMSRQASQEPAETDRNPAPSQTGRKGSKASLASSGGVDANSGETTANHLGSPFMDQGEMAANPGPTERRPSQSNASVRSRAGSIARAGIDKPAASAPSLRGTVAERTSSAHPSPSPALRPLHRREQSTSSLRHETSFSPDQSMSPSADSVFKEDLKDDWLHEGSYFQPRAAPTPPPAAQVLQNHQSTTHGSTPQSPESTVPPRSTLRPKQTRTSNSTPSMLIRHVQQQAAEATNALKSTSAFPITSPDGKRSLTHRKSARSLKISSPQFLSASADLQHMPSVETAASVRSPKEADLAKPSLERKQSSAGLRFKLRFNKSSASKEFEEVAAKAASQPGSPHASPQNGSYVGSTPSSQILERSDSSASGRASTRLGDSQGSVRGLMSRLRMRKNSADLLKGNSNDSAGLMSGHSSREPASDGMVDIIDYPHNAFVTSPTSTATGHAPSASTSRSPVTYNVTSHRKRLGDSIGTQSTGGHIDISPLKVQEESSPKVGTNPLHSSSTTARNLQLSGQDRSSAASQDSMRKLYEAATALGLDSDKVNELVGAAGYQARRESTMPKEDDRIVRSTVVMASASHMPSSHSSDAQHSPLVAWDGHPRSTSDFSAEGLERARLAGQHRTQTENVTAPRTPPLAHKFSGEGEQTPISSSARRVHDRVPTPPPTRANRVRKEASEHSEPPLPRSPPIVPSTASSHAMNAGRTSSSNGSDFQPSQAALAQARMSVRSLGSYDARSIYGLYEDDDIDDLPPEMPDLNLVLASGRIPGASSDTKRASLALAPGLDLRRLSTASRGSRIEVAEYSNGDIAFNIVQSLRDNRKSYFPMDMHRRQDSERSVEEEIIQQAAKSIDADPLKLMVRRHQQSRREAEALEMSRAYQHDAAHPNTEALSHGSMVEIIETDESQVAALIEELTRDLDEGQFNLSRSGTFVTHREESQSSARQLPESILQRRPSKVRRQPPPMV